MKKSQLIKILKEQIKQIKEQSADDSAKRFSTHDVTVRGFTHSFAYPDPQGNETEEGLYSWESKDRGNREVHFVKSQKEAVSSAKQQKVASNENTEMPGQASSGKIGSVNLDDLEEKVRDLYSDKGARAFGDLTWYGDGPVTPFVFISRAFKLCSLGHYPPDMLANIVAEFVKLSGIRVDESPLEGPVAGHDYKNPRTPKDVEDLEVKGYSKIDKRTPSFKYKDDQGEYTPMMKNIQEQEDSLYRQMAYHHSGVLSDFIIPRSVTVEDFDETYLLYFELKVPVAFGYDADEIKTELQVDSYAGPGQSYSRARTLIKRMGADFHVKVWVTGGLDV